MMNTCSLDRCVKPNIINCALQIIDMSNLSINMPKYTWVKMRVLLVNLILTPINHKNANCLKHKIILINFEPLGLTWPTAAGPWRSLGAQAVRSFLAIRDAFRIKNGIMWEKFPSGTPPPLPQYGNFFDEIPFFFLKMSQNEFFSK